MDVTAASTVVPAVTSRTITSELAPLASAATRLVACPLPKATRDPSAEMSGSPCTAALAFTPAELTEMRVIAPVVMSLRKTSRPASVSAGDRFDPAGGEAT